MPYYHTPDLSSYATQADIPSLLVPLRMGDLPVWAIPSALTEYAASARARYNLSQFTQARLVVYVGVVGLGSAELRAQYSTDESSWAYLDGTSGPKLVLDTVGTGQSAWVNLAAGAKADVRLRFVGINGNGIAVTTLGNVFLELT